MPHGQHLSDASENDLLMGDQAGEPYRMNPNAPHERAASTGKQLLLGPRLVRGTDLPDQLRRTKGRAGWGIGLPVVVKLDNLDLRQIRGGVARKSHQ